MINLVRKFTSCTRFTFLSHCFRQKRTERQSCLLTVRNNFFFIAPKISGNFFLVLIVSYSKLIKPVSRCFEIVNSWFYSTLQCLLAFKRSTQCHIITKDTAKPLENLIANFQPRCFKKRALPVHELTKFFLFLKRSLSNRKPYGRVSKQSFLFS